MSYSPTLGLRNLDANDEALLAGIEVTTKAQFDRLGADKVYLLLLESGTQPDAGLHLRLRGAERDVDWEILAEREKKEAKSRFVDIEEL